MYYHGSENGNIKILIPSTSEHEKPYIYLTTNPVVAVFYMVHIVERPYNWFPYGFASEGIPIYTEYYENALKDVYGDKIGYLYEWDDLTDMKNPTNINCAFVYDKELEVERITEISDVYSYLLAQEKLGNVIIERFENHTEQKKLLLSDIIRNEIRDYKLYQTPDISYAQFIKKHFEKDWNDVIKQHQEGEKA